MPNWLKNWILAAISTLLSLAAVEAGLRIFKADLADGTIATNTYSFYRYDPELGWSNQPGAHGVFSAREFSYPVDINKFGMRGPEISLKKPAGIKRIAVLGDSYVWGIGANGKELFTSLLQDQVAGSEVLNFGVSGYGPIQYYLLRTKILDFEPDVVVISFCLGNDFADSVFWRRYDYYKPFARLGTDGKLVIDGYPVPNVKRFGTRYDDMIKWISGRFYIQRLLDRRLSTFLSDFGQKGPADFSEDQSGIYLQPEKASSQYVLRVNRELMKETVASFDQAGIPVIVLAVPTKCEFGECFGIGRKTDAARKALAQIVSGLPVSLVDPAPAFVMSDFWITDGHWRASGHEKIAAALLPVLKSALHQATAAKTSESSAVR